MRKMGLEPTRLYRHKILSLACLPIPALPLISLIRTIFHFPYDCGRWDLNPHVYTDTRSLVLPVCQFQHFRICYSILSNNKKNYSKSFPNRQYLFLNFSRINFSPSESLKKRSFSSPKIS